MAIHIIRRRPRMSPMKKLMPHPVKAPRQYELTVMPVITGLGWLNWLSQCSFCSRPLKTPCSRKPIESAPQICDLLDHIQRTRTRTGKPHRSQPLRAFLFRNTSALLRLLHLRKHRNFKRKSNRWWCEKRKFRPADIQVHGIPDSLPRVFN